MDHPSEKAKPDRKVFAHYMVGTVFLSILYRGSLRQPLIVFLRLASLAASHPSNGRGPRH